MRNREHLRFIVSGAALIAALLTVADAQITVPFPSFTAGTTIQPDEVNQNFAKFSDALNRTGGTMTGTLTTRDILPDGNNTRDLGVTGTRFRDGWFGRNVDVGGTFGATGAVTFGSTLAVNSTGAAAIDVAGGLTAGSGNVGIVSTTGKVPALGAAYFDSTTTSDAWTFSGTMTESGPLVETGIITPSTITADQNDYAPTSFSTARVLRLTHNNAGANRTITGLAGGASGRVVMLCNVNTAASENILLAHESASSTAANRFFLPNLGSAGVQPGACLRIWYDGTSSRWRATGGNS